MKAWVDTLNIICTACGGRLTGDRYKDCDGCDLGFDGDSIDIDDEYDGGDYLYSCDTVCSGCGHIRCVLHDPVGEWLECECCGEMKVPAPADPRIEI